MNLIGNNCLSSYTYKLLNKQFTNPFTWCVINLNYMIDLINNFTDINFNNTYLMPISSNNNAWKYSPKILIDNVIEVNYIHIKFNPSAIIPFTENNQIYTAHPFDYCLNKYNERLSRMTDKPSFIINQSNCEDYTSTGIIKFFDSIKSNYRIYIFCDKNTITSGIYNNIHVFNTEYCCGNSLNKYQLAQKTLPFIKPYCT